MYYFPQKQVDKRGYYHRRTWNAEIPHYDEAVLHWCADTCFEDLAGTEPCEPGSIVYNVPNKTNYPGLDALAVGTPVHQLMISDGFPAIYVPGFYEQYGTQQLRSTQAYALSMHIAVFRCPASTWSNYGSIIGAANIASYGGYPPYLTSNTGNGWDTTSSPKTIQRHNGAVKTPGDTVIGIQNIMCVVFGHDQPSISFQWQVLVNTNGAYSYYPGMYLYEVLGYASYLTTEKIEDIEAHLMDKYGIIA